jgi:hypothetical protein
LGTRVIWLPHSNSVAFGLKQTSAGFYEDTASSGLCLCRRVSAFDASSGRYLLADNDFACFLPLFNEVPKVRYACGGTVKDIRRNFISDVFFDKPFS